MLKAFDSFLTVVHLSILLFNLFGWIWPSTRKMHLVVVLVTAFCWLVLGIWYGIGFCPVTHLQWEVKAALGETNLPNSFVTYCLYGIGLKMIPENAITWGTGISFAMAGSLALYFNVFRPVYRRAFVRS